MHQWKHSFNFCFSERRVVVIAALRSSRNLGMFTLLSSDDTQTDFKVARIWGVGFKNVSSYGV